MNEILTAEEKDKFYKAGFEAGKEHNEPSQKTKDFMIEFKMEIKTIKEKLETMPTRDEMSLCLEKAIDKVMERAESRFASKTTEKVVYGMVGAILLFALGKILNLI